MGLTGTLGVPEKSVSLLFDQLFALFYPIWALVHIGFEFAETFVYAKKSAVS